MRRWIRFFLGSPQRFVASLVGVGFIVCLISPGLFEQTMSQAVSAVILALQPVVGPALAIVIVFAGLKYIVFGRK